MNWIRDLVRKEAPNADWKDFWFGVVLGVILLISLGIDSIDGSYAVDSYALASIAAVSAWIAIYRLRHRHPERPLPPDVRQDFATVDGGKVRDFGFRNFGTGPALYFQFVGIVNGEERVHLSPLDRPIHLAEGEFVGLVEDGCPDGRLLRGGEDDAEVTLYCAYVSTEGVRGPRGLDIPDDHAEKCVLNEITESHPQPQRTSIQRIRTELN